MEIIKVLGDIGIFSVAAYFIQLYLSKSADRKFEAYKFELDSKTREFQATLDGRIELYRAELNLQNYKSTQIYERQLSIIIELHKKIIKLNKEMIRMTAILKPIIENAEEEESARIKTVGEAYDDFLDYYRENLIFIPKKTTTALDAIVNDYFNSYRDYNASKILGYSDEFTREKSFAAAEMVKEKIQPALELLITDFRELIGLENTKN